MRNKSKSKTETKFAKRFKLFITIVISTVVMMAVSIYAVGNYERVYYFITGQHSRNYLELIGSKSSVSVSFIDCGMGDSALIKAGSDNVLIDAGDYGSEDMVLDCLEYENVSHIDYLIISHPHTDHFGAADEIVKQFDVDTVIITYVPDSCDEPSAAWNYFIDLVDSKKVELVTADSEDVINLDRGYIEILWAGNDDCEDMNACSIVAKYTYGKRSFLFTGDAEFATENALLDRGVYLESDVLKAGHHGSRHATSERFLRKVKPDYVIVSCSKDNQYGFPKAEFVDRVRKSGAEMYITCDSGTITFITNGIALERLY